ncbi:retrovirus-related pol polyprotein from transposon TNT 1-94 [Tanacetum coccineum]
MSIRISVEHSVAHVHTQNGLAESLIKRIQMTARPMIMKPKLPISAWGHAVLHAATLIRIRPTSHHTYSPLQLVFGQEPNISHLRIFGCVIYVPIAPPQRIKMRSQRRMGIYVGYDSPSIIRYLKPSTRDLFTTRFADCHFDESVFPTLGGDKKQLRSEISWNELSLSYLDPRTKECEQEVQRIIHLQGLANQLPDAFTDLKRVTKPHILAANAPVKIDIPKEHLEITNESKARLKRGRPIGSKDKNPRKKKGACNQDGQIEVKETLEGSSIRTLDMTVQKEPQVPENEEISINYVMSRKIWNQNEIDVDDTFTYNVALKVMENDEDHEPKSVPECKNRNDWPKWKDAVEAKLKSLKKREVFGPVVRTPEGELPKAVEYLKKEFEMKDLGKTKFCLGLQIEHLKNRILVHQNAYTEKLLKRFYMDKSNPLSTPMVVRTLDVEKDPFRPPDDDEEMLGQKYSSCPTRRHWNEMRDICLIPTGRSQTEYVFISSNTAISWRSIKQTMSATSSNHEEILAIHEASRRMTYVRKRHALLNLKTDTSKIRSSDNLADLFTKALPTATFKRLVHGIGMRRLEELK